MLIAIIMSTLWAKKKKKVELKYWMSIIYKLGGVIGINVV